MAKVTSGGRRPYHQGLLPLANEPPGASGRYCALLGPVCRLAAVPGCRGGLVAVQDAVEADRGVPEGRQCEDDQQVGGG